MLREIIRSVLAGEPCAPANSRRLRLIGCIVLAIAVVTPVAEYLLGRFVLARLSVEGLVLSPAFRFSTDVVLLGLLFPVLSTVFRHGTELEEERTLTVYPQPTLFHPMPIEVSLDLMLTKRRMSLTEVSERVGITLANLSIIKTNKAKVIVFSTLEAICRELECQPGDLFEYVTSRLPIRPAPEPLQASLGRGPWLTESPPAEGGVCRHA